MTDPFHNAAGSLAARDLESVFHPSTNLAKLPQQGAHVLVRGEGVYVWDDGGKQYLEGMAGLWCTSLGYGNERLARVAAEQMRTLSYTHLFAGKTHEPAILLAECLKAMVPGGADKVFFGNSGSDANDTQVKLMWYYHNAIGKPEKKKIIGRKRGYHGITLASASLTGLPAQHASFDLPLPQMKHVSCPHFYRNGEPGETEAAFATRMVRELEQCILDEGPDTVAAFIAEPVMGAGGVIPPPADYLQQVQAMLRRHDVLFIDDEVITGFGRTGSAFGSTTYGIEPSTTTLAKALSSAYLPISAVLVPDWLYDPVAEQSGRIGNFGHGYTYSGHPVCAAVALETLKIYEETQLFDAVARLSPQFQARLRALGGHPLVGEARGVGLIGAVELVADKATKASFEPARGVGALCANHCRERGLITRALGDSIALCPPLVITEAQVDELFTKLEGALDDTLAAIRAG
jgi:4-aminobutyrate--pyruvate transaminase